MYGRILKSLNIVNLYREMFKLKLKINVKVPQLLCIVVSVALNGGFERFGGFCDGCCCSVSVYIRNIKKCGRILKSLNIINLYREMFKLKLKINVKVPQLLCIVVSVALNGEFERFGGICNGCCYMLSSSIFSHTFLYISNINRHTACVGPL